MCLFITIFIRVDFSAIEISAFSIKIDVVQTEKYPIHDLRLSLSVGDHQHKLCKIIHAAMERWSLWCFLYQLTWLQKPPWCGAAMRNRAPGVAPIQHQFYEIIYNQQK